MTVLLRPIPKRTVGNSIVPFGRAQYTYKPNPVGLKDWKPPTPEPLQPAPLLGLGSLAVLGLQALAFAWGQLNGRKGGGSQNWQGPIGPEIVPLTVATGQGNGSGLMQLSITATPSSANTGVGAPDDSVISQWIEPSEDGQPGRFNYRWSYVSPTSGPGVGAIYFGNSSFALSFGTNPDGSYQVQTGGWFRTGETTPQPEVAVLPPLPLVPAITPAPLTDAPETLPQVFPAVPIKIPLAPPQVLPQPSTEPQTLPQPSPLVPVTPGPVAPPVVKPALPTTTAPIKVPLPTAVSNGVVVAPAPTPVAVTPQDAIFPVPGGLPVTGQTVRRTVQGIAQEVGRIEQKIDKMVNPTPGQWGDVPNTGDLLKDALEQIVGAVMALTSGTTYTLDSPCEVDEVTGEKLPPVVVQASGAITTFGAILNRIDAIAELIQVHKDLKQPNCKPKQPVGEFVTVNFEEID